MAMISRQSRRVVGVVEEIPEDYFVEALTGE